MSEENGAGQRKRAAGLGRGLSALLGEAEREQSVAPGAQGSGVRMLPVASIAPHPDQPRRHFDEAALEELAQSIAARGMIQPIVVRPHGSGWQIVAGERRWRAAQRARLHEVPVLVRDFDEAATLEVALIENIQRQDLNAIEEAEAYQRLIAEFGHTQEALGRLVHKSRSHIANLLRLLDLPASVRVAVADGRLSMGHARALVTASDPERLAEEVIAGSLSVRETEELARAAKPGGGVVGAAEPKAAAPSARKVEADADVLALERHIADLIGLKVKIAHSPNNGGSVTIGYTTLEQLDLICARLSGEAV